MNPFRTGWSVAIGISILIFVAAYWFVYSKISALETALRGQQPQIQASDDKMKARARTELLDLQERCSDQARKEFESSGYKFGGGDDYESHYNAELNKCFMLIKSNRANGIIKILSDAYEGRLNRPIMMPAYV